MVAADRRLDELAVKLEAKQKIYKFRDSLRKLRGYDAIFIDTPPALNFYSRSALIAADRVLIPFDCDEFARQALYSLLDNIDEVRADHNEALMVEGIVVNQFQSRSPAGPHGRRAEGGRPSRARPDGQQLGAGQGIA